MGNAATGGKWSQYVNYISQSVHDCNSKASAAAADDFSAMRTWPKARDIAGRAILGAVAGAAVGRGSITTAAGGPALAAYYPNVGGAVVGAAKFAWTAIGCYLSIFPGS